MSGKYKYERIDLGGPAFRLLRLHHGVGSDLTCELFQAWLHQRDDAVSYEALSYTWGSTEISESILVNGKRLGITLNLYLALQQLRLPDEDRIIWVDAVCIDQSDKKERGHQVQQMGDIFKEADRVIFWLGPGNYQTNVFMESMQLLQKESLKHPCKSWTPDDERWKQLWEKVQMPLRKVHADLANNQRRGLEILLERPWFRRVWILQEVTNARAGIVCCGTRMFSARLFGFAPSILDVNPDSHCQAVLDVMPGPWRQSSWWSQSQNLYTLLLNFGGSEATESRDIIYALRGMSSDAKGAQYLLPDYEKPEEELVRDVIRFIYYCELDDLREYDIPPTTIQSLMERLRSLNATCCKALAKSQKTSDMEMLLKRADVKVDNEVLQAAVLHNSTGEMMEMLLRNRNDEVILNRQLLLSAASNEIGAKEVFEVLTRYREDEVVIEADLLVVAAKNQGCGVRILEYLLQRRTRHLDMSTVAEGAAKNTKTAVDVMKVIAREYGHLQRITATLLLNAAKNSGCGTSLFEFLFQQYPNDMKITDANIEAAIQNDECGLDIMKVFLKYRPQDVNLTQPVLRACTRSANGADIITQIIQRKSIGIPLELEEEFITFTRFSNTSLAKQFFQLRNPGLVITMRVADAAIDHNLSGEAIIKVALRDKQYDIKVNDDAAMHLATSFDVNMSEYLFAYRREQVLRNDALIDKMLERFMTDGERKIWSPLQFASRRGYVGMAELLLIRGMDIEEKYNPTEIRGTALTLAADSGHGAVVSLLLSYGADVDITDLYGRRPISMAVNGGNYYITNVLLQHGTDPDYSGDHGITPLMLAAQRGYLEIVRLLLEYGADVTAIDNNGYAVRSHAATSGMEAVVNLINEHDRLGVRMIREPSTAKASLLLAQEKLKERENHAKRNCMPTP